MAKKAPTSEKIALNGWRAAFVEIAEAKYFDPQKPGPNEKRKFRLTFLGDPTNAEHAKTIALLKSEAKRILIEDYGDEASIPKKSLERCFGTDEDLDKVYDGFKGMFFIKTSAYGDDNNPKAPFIKVVGRRKNADGKFTPILPGSPEWPYGGCYVNGKITLWSQGGSHNRHAINANLLALQFVRNGEAFGNAGTDPNDEFEALEDAPDGSSEKDPWDE